MYECSAYIRRMSGDDRVRNRQRQEAGLERPLRHPLSMAPGMGAPRAADPFAACCERGARA